MKKLLAPLLLILAGLTAFAIAFAQPAIGDPIDWGQIPTYFQSPEWLAALVFTTVALLKKHVFKTFTDTLGLVLSFGVGAALGVVGGITGWTGAGVAPSVVLGVSAAYLASGGFDGLKDLLGGLLGKSRT